MSWQCLFLQCNERTLWHFLPKEMSFITVEDLMCNTSMQSLYSVPDLSKLLPSPFVFTKLATRSRGQSYENRGNRRNPRQIFHRKNRQKMKPTISEGTENRGITVPDAKQ
ncbi:hypothetical protein AVEN_266541-1 [Araneus ventricosus]|uniref:Uncharacterized protein n=1 Tax=Araneus ventricosus TaxID=182803 RepID=A0A4Y2RXL4_ARAVE|nr:hypothetical protein AVEN_266541-1 [Araneus ventricosus]